MKLPSHYTSSFQRLGIFCGILAFFGFVSFEALPILQHLATSRLTPDIGRLAIVHPIIVIRLFCAVVTTTFATTLILAKLAERWREHDTKQVVKENLIVKYIMIFILSVILSLSLIGYSRCRYQFESDHVLVYRLFDYKRMTYNDITTLTMLPPGEWSDSVREEGPWYRIVFREGYRMDISHRNEGISEEELHVLAIKISERSGKAWGRFGDARPMR
jgi:hypothetical protein